MSNLTIDQDRLWASLMETAQIGGTPDGGIARLTLSEDDKRVRDWLSAECAALGMVLTVDEAGNMYFVAHRETTANPNLQAATSEFCHVAHQL